MKLGVDTMQSITGGQICLPTGVTFWVLGASGSLGAPTLLPALVLGTSYA